MKMEIQIEILKKNLTIPQLNHNLTYLFLISTWIKNFIAVDGILDFH